MREKMKENGIYVSEKISSFGLESLLWNVEVSTYKRYSCLRFVFDEVVKFLYNDISDFEEYLEANGIKPLFPDQNTKLAYIQFVRDLREVYEYDI